MDNEIIRHITELGGVTVIAIFAIWQSHKTFREHISVLNERIGELSSCIKDLKNRITKD